MLSSRGVKINKKDHLVFYFPKPGFKRNSVLSILVWNHTFTCCRILAGRVGARPGGVQVRPPGDANGGLECGFPVYHGNDGVWPFVRLNFNHDKKSPVSNGKSLYHDDKGKNPPHEAIAFPVPSAGDHPTAGECFLPSPLHATSPSAAARPDRLRTAVRHGFVNFVYLR